MVILDRLMQMRRSYVSRATTFLYVVIFITCTRGSNLAIALSLFLIVAKRFVSLQLPLFLALSILHAMADPASANVIKAAYQCHVHAMPMISDPSLPLCQAHVNVNPGPQIYGLPASQPQFHVAMYPSSPEPHVLQTQTAIAPRIPTDPTT